MPGTFKEKVIIPQLNGYRAVPIQIPYVTDKAAIRTEQLWV
ncbi:hypothetical protein F441_15878 [Phytophthora nicotianae CJ01A1]|uniref:Uncharacterized protein n=6 Tax=Phytophthora nicotianae TaxID=4792 RepID=W2PUB1_PHYN3|nr:hypothetical protein PPTG_23760 [Phytophthora nicotianae INRA-310]ETI38157.1 hypothetical protein F443_16039 [Phytophthora nicotianae P1569]ETK78360.1 hypothetical protein L915_15596 [Phytophthora nicotianae]ETO66920.1 hypothetical protein F444_16024 [Phytophthora nicotianae P1976]ETP08031.1 hypothetical protein F441_15878 [Phytophthora nicotianae CJ01A1]ETP36089.1 hypothetical protein F442_15883 [Phytophthora nicotianae P10297]